MQPPLTNLQPGQTGPQVDQLQKWLMALGYLSAADYATGPGTYGPKTTAAVAKVQQQLGVDNSTGIGFWGPRTVSAVEGRFGYTPTPAPSPTPTAQTTAPTTTTAPAAQTTNNVGAMQRAVISAVADVAKNAAAIGKPPVSFADALAFAAKDPNIVAKYADMSKLDTNAFQQSLEQLREQASTGQSNLATQFANERRQLAEASAAAGQAYSGFRGRAQEQLGQEQSGIVQSSRATLQKNLQDLTTAFESKYGSALTNPATAPFLDPSAAGGISISGLATPGSGGTSTLSGQLAGGITGAVAPAKASEINSSALSSYQATQFPQV